MWPRYLFLGVRPTRVILKCSVSEPETTAQKLQACFQVRKLGVWRSESHVALFVCLGPFHHTTGSVQVWTGSKPVRFHESIVNLEPDHQQTILNRTTNEPNRRSGSAQNRFNWVRNRTTATLDGFFIGSRICALPLQGVLSPFTVVEGIFFSRLSASIFWLKKRGSNSVDIALEVPKASLFNDLESLHRQRLS